METVASGNRRIQRKLSSQAISKDRTLSALMREAQNGSDGAYLRLLQEIQPIVQRIIRRQWAKASSSDHDDLLQEVMLKVHAARATFDPSQPFIPWLKTIVMNKTIDFMRKQARQRALWSPSDSAAADVADESSYEAFHRYEAVASVRKAVSALPGCQRTAIELLKLRELSLSEATTMTGMSASALKASIHRALMS